MEMKFHDGPQAHTIEYVNWFHRKFRSPYNYNMFTSMKADHMVLADLIDRYDMRTFLEIGTWKGYTALMAYMHPKIERVKCIDIHEGMGVEYGDKIHAVSHHLDKKETYGEYFKNTFVQLQFADTLTYPRGCEEHDLIFIDGNHDEKHVRNDTELAVSMNPKLVVWHDYGSKGYGGYGCYVTEYIDEIAGYGTPILRFSGSLCVAALGESIITTQKGETR
jgi:hypothetical protein